MEMTIVVIIASVLASLAIPRFTGAFERVRASEGVNLLTALLSAQKAYEAETGAYSTDPALLDIEITTSSNFEVPPTVDDVDPIASIRRISAYWLTIDADGTVNCVDAGASWTCVQAGF